MSRKKVLLICMILFLVGGTMGFIYYFHKDSNEDKVLSSSNEKEESIEVLCELNLNLKDVTIFYGDTYEESDFFESWDITCDDYDLETDGTYSFETEEMGKYSDLGTYEVTIVASVDSIYAKGTATLTIEEKTVENDASTSKSYAVDSSNSKSTTNSSSTTTTTTTLSCEEKLALSSNPSKISGFKEYTTETSSSDTYKYGVKITTTTTYTYAVFSDIGKCLYNESSTNTYDRSGYNATTKELRSEAESVLANNLSSVKSAIDTLNGYRSEVNKEALEYDYNLSLAATIRAIEMYWSGTFDHIRPDGSKCFTVLGDLGITYYTAGENIANGQGSLASAMVSWKNSTGHYENMINDNFTKVGLGAYNKYYVTLFQG